MRARTAEAPSTPPRRVARGRAGFTFIELIVGLAIMVMIASVVAPVLLGSLDNARVDKAIDTFVSIGTGIVNFNNDVTDYPGQLSQLTTAVTSTQTNLCGTAYGTTKAGRWAGPYVDRLLPTTGLPVLVGRARNALMRFPTTGTSPSQLWLPVDSVVIEDALAVNKKIDDDGDNGSANTVQWTAPSTDGLVTMYFIVPVGGGC